MSAERRPFGKFLSRFGKEAVKPAEKSPAVPVFELSRQINDHILVNKEDQAWLMGNVTEKIHEQLSPVAAALDAMYKDNLTRSENLLMKDKKGNIQFILGNLDEDGELTVVSMKGHTIKTPDGKKEPGCQSAVFYKTTPDRIAYYQQNFIEIAENKKKEEIFKGIKLQANGADREALGFVLDKNDQISLVSHYGIHLRGDGFKDWAISNYKFTDKSFSVKMHQYLYYRPFMDEIGYIPDQKGSFVRKMPKKQHDTPFLQAMPIEQEIQHIIAKLPLEK